MAMDRCAAPIELGWTRCFGEDSRPLTAAPGRSLVVTLRVDIDAIASEGPDLVAAAARAGSELIQGFGFPELLQFETDGTARLQFWAREMGWRPSLTAWANAHGVTITES